MAENTQPLSPQGYNLYGEPTNTNPFWDQSDVPAGHGVPAGGKAGQVLGKKTDADYDTEWIDQTGSSGEATTVSVVVEDTYTLPPGYDANVYDAYEGPDKGKNVHLVFEIPRGDVGPQGPAGPKGDPGTELPVGTVGDILVQGENGPVWKPENEAVSGLYEDVDDIQTGLSGGTAGQVLTRLDAGGYGWEDPSGGSGGAADSLKTPQMIDGIPFNGTGPVSHYGTCTTEANTFTKIVYTDSDLSFVGILRTGTFMFVRFTRPNADTSNITYLRLVGSDGSQYTNLVRNFDGTTANVNWTADVPQLFLFISPSWYHMSQSQLPSGTQGNILLYNGGKWTAMAPGNIAATGATHSLLGLTADNGVEWLDEEDAVPRLYEEVREINLKGVINKNLAIEANMIYNEGDEYARIEASSDEFIIQDYMFDITWAVEIDGFTRIMGIISTDAAGNGYWDPNCTSQIFTEEDDDTGTWAAEQLASPFNLVQTLSNGDRGNALNIPYTSNSSEEKTVSLIIKWKEYGT